MLCLGFNGKIIFLPHLQGGNVDCIQFLEMTYLFYIGGSQRHSFYIESVNNQVTTVIVPFYSRHSL